MDAPRQTVPEREPTMNARALPVSDATCPDRAAGGTGQHSGSATAFDARHFRRALGPFATGVAVISTGSGDPLPALTANPLMVGSLEHPVDVGCGRPRARTQ